VAGRAHGREVGRRTEDEAEADDVEGAGCRFDRFSNVKRLLLALLLGFLAVAVIANSVLIVNRQEALGRVSRYNLTWLLSQAAHEVLRLEETISASALPGQPTSTATRWRSGSTCWSTAWSCCAPARRRVHRRAARPQAQRRGARGALATIDKLIPGLPNPEVVLKIRNLLEPQVPRMLQLAAAANVRSGDVVAQDQHDLSFQHWLLTGPAGDRRRADRRAALPLRLGAAAFQDRPRARD
jgi:hypothetical protein